MKTFPTTLPSLERIFSISHEIIANPSLEDVLHSIVQVAAELVACEGASILLSDSSLTTLNFVAATNYKDQLFNVSVPIEHSIAGSAFKSNHPVKVLDVSQEPLYFPEADKHTNFPANSVLAVPLTFQERKIGVIEVVNKKQGQFDDADIEMLVALAAQATITIEIARLYRQMQAEIAERLKAEEELRRHQEHLEELVKERTAEVHRLAIIDQLTGLFNRGQLMNLGDQAMRKAYVDRNSFSAMMIDIDHFKKINETYGHAIGDEVLKKLAGILQEYFRSNDIIGRYMGEEFAILMPNTNLESAYELADHLLNQIRELQMDTVQGQFGFTVSIGLVEMDQTRRQTLDSLVDLTDRAMDAAKQAGRNQVFIGNLLAEVQRQAFTDPLTGLFTRGYWMLLGTQALQEALRYHQPFSAIMIDGDRFKNINDNFGHAKGDEAAQKMAHTLKQNVRSADIAGRYGGGDEFIVLMPHTNLQSACELADRLLNKIRELRIDTGQGKFLTVSIGVVEINQNYPHTLAELVELADQAQYVAKRAGGNQVSVGNQEHSITE